MDPLSDVLSLLKPRTYSSGGLDAGGEWSVGFPQYEGIKCYAVASGQCWLAVDEIPHAMHLKNGDCFLMPSQRAFRLASNPKLAPVDVKKILAHSVSGGIVSVNGGGDCFIVGGHFTLAGDHARILVEALPPVVHLRTEADKADLRWSLDRMRQELRAPRPGGDLIAQHLAQMILIQAIRLLLEGSFEGAVGWIFALADKQLSAAMHAMHERPAYPWTLQALAEHAGMSRTVFASRFRETVGSSVMEYLARWRMLLAANKLATSHDSVAAIALELGYESESAFSKAFKRVMGCSPRQYARGCGAAPARGMDRPVLVQSA